MKIPTNLFKFSFIALGWIVFILLCYVAFKDEKTNVLITMKDSLREAINIDYQERLNKILIHYRPLGRGRGRGRGRWISEFEASLVYRVSSRTARAIQRNPVLKKKSL